MADRWEPLFESNPPGGAGNWATMRVRSDVAPRKLLGSRAFVERLDLGEQPRHPFLIEHLIGAGWGNVGERRLVEQAGVHEALVHQMLDDHVDEFDLGYRRRSGRQEFAERLAAVRRDPPLHLAQAHAT